MAAMNESMRLELTAKGETIISECGQAARMLIKNSDLHDELMKAAKLFAAQETSLMFKQMQTLIQDLKSKVDRTESSLQELPKICELFQETEKIYTAAKNLKLGQQEPQETDSTSTNDGAFPSPLEYTQL